MGVVVLTGPAATGKNTIANLLARKIIKGADIFWYLVRDYQVSFVLGCHYNLIV